ncbi:SDR family NAD(P)-dependent oxidoreductase [Jiulongibacter sp. NS-SX5]|uniref:SDR family NAD(P)-dependent oxidoreductase n=1 Tax=Jiulongibacter sp. NS-SX5 TaxID=3463854 RepID=UPI004057F694
MKRFENKVCFVTGAGSGIGKATALAFAKEGAQVVVTDINGEAAGQTLNEIKQISNTRAIAITLDISQREQVENAIQNTVNAFGRLDCAANCAGVAGPLSAKTHEYPEEFWHQQIAVNLTGNWFLLKYQLEQMLKNGGGNIVMLSSAAGLIGQPENSPYAVSKHGIEGMMKTAAIEYATHNIRVNSVCPTAIETPMIMHGRRNLAVNKEARNEAINFQRMKRMGKPDEVADVVLWLCSDESSFITGSSIKADGGALA